MRLFVNVYKVDRSGTVFNNVVHPDEETANRSAFTDRLECVEIDFPGTIVEARRELKYSSPEQLRHRYPVPAPTPIVAQVAAALPPKRALTLPVDSEARKNIQLLAGFLNYIPAAAVKFAEHAKAGNDKHNKGEPLHHARWKSTDHEECLIRHLVDIQDYKAHLARGTLPSEEAIKALISEATAEFWRSGVFLQELCEKYEGAPLAPAARVQEEQK
jgi:hypothetical protein